jgi:glycerol-3-phosphate dehydrogenase
LSVPIERGDLLSALRDPRPWDVVVIGGGATGLGLAVDAAARGLRTALIEARDFSSGTSSRSTKLIHGGVRYLAQGNVKLVREALVERALLLANAPSLVKPLEFVVPCYRIGEREFMRVGLGLYDALAGSRSVGATRWLGRAETLDLLPGVRERGLHGGVAYWDAQFDDARLAIALMRTARRLGAVPINYVRAESIVQDSGRAVEVIAVDQESGERFALRSRVIFNATGVWVDAVRRLADPAARPLVTVSRGSHVIVDRQFLPGWQAMTIPRTADGRVLFAIPWRGRLMLGTTDVPVDLSTEFFTDHPQFEPRATEPEIEFILGTARAYLSPAPQRNDVIGSFAGLRPLFAPHAAGATKTISREHSIVIEHKAMLTITGGKWTTYRRMADDALGQAISHGLLPESRSSTASLRLEVDAAVETACSDAERLPASIRAVETYTRLAKRHEQARTADDVLARRMRTGLIDLKAAEAVRPAVEAALRQ